MQMVAAVVRREQLVRMLGIADDAIKVDHRIEMARGPDPLVDGLAVSLTERARMVVARSNVGGDRRANNAQAVSVRSRDDLLIRGKNALNEGRMIGRRDLTGTGQAAEIIYSFKHDDPLDTSWSEYIAIETSEGIRSQAVSEQMIAADALV